MKMVKSLLLGSAAGLVAVAGAQAADLPVKAKPVEYVKVCSLYGAGYYYMPGSDICLKLGGYVRYQFTQNPGSSISAGPFNLGGSLNSRTTVVDSATRTRAVVTVDTRQQTAYGTLRTYILLGFQQDSTLAPTTSPNVYMTRGFLQIAGFTFGKATSFFDIYPNASFSYNAGNVYTPDTGDGGQMLAAYTAQFGNGFSATISVEQSRAAAIVGPGVTAAGVSVVGGLPIATGPGFTNGSALAFGAAPGNNANGITTVPGTSLTPDIVGNLRLDQAWGSVLVGGAVKQVTGGYYTGGPGFFAGSAPQSEEIGYAVTGGFIFNLPFIAAGDRLSAQAVYSEGAIKYAAVTPSGGGGSFIGRFDNGSAGGGFLMDGVFTNPGGASPQVSLTTAFSMSAAFEHFWTPALRTSVYGSYIDVSYSGAGRNAICSSNFLGGGATPVGAPGACNPDFQAYNIGSRTQWEPVRGLIMGVDVIYNKIESASTRLGTTTFAPYAPSTTTITVPVRDQDAFTGTFRIQRDFLP